jgi:phosphoenolpyruvate carboxykinase (ATP)
MKLKYTRAMITAALNGELDAVEYKYVQFFGLAIPQTCPDVPDDILNQAKHGVMQLYDQKQLN